MGMNLKLWGRARILNRKRAGSALRLKFAILGIFIVTFLCLASIDFNASASGSRNLTATQQSNGTWISNTGYRPYTEWYGATTAGIARHQVLKVFVNAGETLYFGSSVAGSTVAGGEIVVRKADGTSVPAASLNVDAGTGVGYINTRAKEMAGPNYPSSGNTSGYTPLSLAVDQTGVWEFEFHSTSNNTTNPTASLTTSDTLVANQGGGAVAAWDITVVKTESGVPAAVPGRVYTNFLSMNMGGNFFGSDVLKAVVYVLTKDGFVYQTSFNGMDPYGFIFFGNNRGLINANTNTSLYQSGVSADNSMTTISSNGIPVQFQSPISSDSVMDSTFKIFFDIPAVDLPEYIKPVAYAPGSISDFTFIGDTNNHGYVGFGGYFQFNATRTSSYEIKLDMTHYKNADNTITDRGIVYLANACVEGQNRIFWDGRDAFGQVVPAGTYGGADSGITITLSAKSGEYHFPMFDVENNRNGVIIKMISDPVDINNQVIPVTSAERSTVYYNNSYVPKIVAENAVQNMLAGIDSTTGASIFGKTAASAGDFAAIDIWSYYKGGSSEVPINPNSFVLEPASVNKGNIKGFVFFDKDSNKLFSMIAGEYSLQDITVELYQAGVLVSSTETDALGTYSFSNIDYGNYEIRVIKPYAHAVCTTANLSQALTLGAVTAPSGWAEAADVGIVYAKAKAITVNKSWTVSKAQDPSQPDNVTIHLTAQKGTAVEFTESISLSSYNSWNHTFFDLPLYAADGVTQLTYSVSEDPIDGYVQTGIATSSTTTQTIYTISNAPKCQITLTKVDTADADLKLSDAEFELWKKDAGGGPDLLITTETTNTSGVIYVSDLEEGTYYFKEIKAPPGYILDPLTAVTSDIAVSYSADGFKKTVTVENTEVCSFSLIKTITQVSDITEQFLFEITGPDGTCYAVLTVPEGQTTATQNFAGMPVGTYTVTEKPYNWRYSLDTSLTQADDGTNAFPLSGGMLSMMIDNGLNSNYRFSFVNSKTINTWVSGHSSVTNSMH